MNKCGELLRSSFVKGILCGIVFAAIFFTSWKLFALLGVIWLVYCVFKCK